MTTEYYTARDNFVSKGGRVCDGRGDAVNLVYTYTSI